MSKTEIKKLIESVEWQENYITERKNAFKKELKLHRRDLLSTKRKLKKLQIMKNQSEGGV
jgi:hypothetical protein